jgi:hypothetical protein
MILMILGLGEHCVYINDSMGIYIDSPSNTKTLNPSFVAPK